MNENIFILCLIGFLSFLIIFDFMWHKSKKKEHHSWVKFDLNDFRTYPTEGVEVLCYAVVWESYYIAYLLNDNNTVTWTEGSNNLESNNYPLVWKYIEKDHAKI